MEEFVEIFDFDLLHRIIRCKECYYAIAPIHVKIHLARKHVRLSKSQRRSIIAAVNGLPQLAQRESDVIYPDPYDCRVDGYLVWYDGMRCKWEDENGVQCRSLYRTLHGIQEHCKEAHQWTNIQHRGGNKRSQQKHTPNKLWVENRVCQQFFRASGWKRCFEVEAGHIEEPDSARHSGQSSEHPVRDFFREQEDDIRRSQADVVEQSNRVEGFDSHRSAAIPWLQTTGIADHLQGLKKDEIRAAIALPVDGDDRVLEYLLQSMEAMLQEAHSWCFDGPDYMLTWPCRVVLSRFQSVQVEVLGSTRAFDPRKQPSTIKAYFKLAKQCLAYFRRVAISREYHFSVDAGRAGSRPEESIDLTTEQHQKWQSIIRLTRLREADPDSVSEEDVREKLVELWMLLITHNTGARRYRSPLLSFCAMLSIKLSTSSWLEPGNFNSNLSAIIWVVQLLIFYDSARKERQDHGDTLRLVKLRCEECLQQTTDTPMGEILRWRLLLFKISKDSVGTHQATWDEKEEALTYQGIELHMSDVSSLLASEYRECRRLLYNDLMFGTKGVRHIHAWDLKDNMDVRTVGWNFSQYRDNAALLQGTETTLLSCIEKSEHLCKLFLVQTSKEDGGLTWRESAIASYKATVQRFLERLIVLVHIESGTPLRESELFSITWKNTQRNRSIYIHLGRLMIHTTYDKLQQQRGSFRDNVRFLSQPIADLLLDYLVYVLPLYQVFVRHSRPGATLSPYLWAKDGKVWTESTLSRCLENASDRAATPRLHIANWRQMTVAIVKTKFASQIGCFEIDPEDEDAEEMEEDIRILTRMRNHKTRTVNRAYANQTGANFGNVWDGLIRMGLRASTLWQDFWGLSLIVRKRKRSDDDEGGTPGLTKRITMGVYRPRKPWSTEALLGGLRDLYQDDSLEWKSAEQAQALTSVMSWTEQVVIVLPTNAGKSAVFMLPCTLPDAGITVLIVPLVSLRCDLLRRLNELRINHIEWLPGEKREAALVLISVEAAATEDFLSYARRLVDQQKLDRIVFDECHLTVTAASYRETMIDITNIRDLRTQFVYLTATLPPSIFAEFEERNHLLRPKVIQVSSNRPNISYEVRRAISGRGTLLQQAAGFARYESHLTAFDATQDKIILYTRTRHEAEELAEILQCPTYTSKIGSAVVKERVVADWIQSPSQPYITATAALAEGLDYPHIRAVINVHEPDSLVMFAQQTGRAGRDGGRARSIVLLPPNWRPAIPTVDQEPVATERSAIRDASLREQRERQAVQRYLSGKRCFRTSLTEHLDPTSARRWCMVADVACAVCKVCHVEPLPAQPPTQRESAVEERSTGTAEIRRVRRQEFSELARFREDLVAVRGSCLLCRGLGQQWDHPFSSCARQHEVFQARDRAREQYKRRGKPWIVPYTACFWCLNPQSVCSRAVSNPRRDGQECEDKDVVLPLCCGIFLSVDGPRWLEEHFTRRFDDIDAFYDWLREESRFGGTPAIQAVRVAAERLREFRLS